MLAVSDLSVARGGIALLQGVTFAVDAGQALILRGPNGVGKSTLLRTIAGLQPALGGQVNLSPDQIAYAGHADAIKATLTVRENLQFWAAIHGTDRVDAAMAAFDLRALSERPAQTLSAGQKRRLGLARLLTTGRKMWLLDEPTVSLDREAVALFGGVLRDHLAGGGAALLATHIDMGLPEARLLDLAPFRSDTRRATAPAGPAGFDEAFL